MKWRTFVFLLIVLLIPISVSALDFRPFLSWQDEDLSELNRLEAEISTKLKADPSLKDISSVFEEYRRLLNKNQTVLIFLRDTLRLPDKLAKDDLSRRDLSEAILGLRNRLEMMYSLWLIRYSPDLERRLIDNLHSVLKNSGDNYVRREAIYSLGILRSKSSLPVLYALRDDQDNTVRRHVLEAIEEIQNPDPVWRTYEDIEKLFDDLRGMAEEYK